MSWKRKKIAEVHKTYFDWDEFFGTIIAIGAVLVFLFFWITG